MDSEKLRQLQLENELTNEELADVLGVSLSLVEKWRNGTRPIKIWHERSIEVILEKPKRRSRKR